MPVRLYELRVGAYSQQAVLYPDFTDLPASTSRLTPGTALIPTVPTSTAPAVSR